MSKEEAIALFGARLADLAAAVGLGPGAVSQWPEVLTRRQHDQVVGAAVRLGRIHRSDLSRFIETRSAAPRRAV